MHEVTPSCEVQLGTAANICNLGSWEAGTEKEFKATLYCVEICLKQMTSAQTKKAISWRGRRT